MAASAVWAAALQQSAPTLALYLVAAWLLPKFASGF